MRRILAFFLWAALIPAAALAQLGTPDPAFGSGGSVTTDFGPNSESANDVAVQSDGKIVIVGTTFTGSLTSDLILARYHPNGTLDTAFGTSGIVTTNFGTGEALGMGVAIQGNGKIVAAGYRVLFPGYMVCLARYESNGTLDTTFGTAGKVSRTVGDYSDIQAVAIQPDGKILIAGSLRLTGGAITYMGLQRYQANGTLDSTFGINGTVNRGPGADNRAYAMKLLADGRIILAGSTAASLGGKTNVLTFRFKPNGSPDSTFANVGRAITTLNVNFGDVGGGVDVTPDGKVLVAAASASGKTSSNKVGLIRFLADGTLDTTFGAHGIAMSPVVGTDGGSISVAGLLQADTQRIIIGGTATFPGSGLDFVLTQFSASGAFDSTFGVNGFRNTDFGPNGNDGLSSLIKQKDGNILAVGSGGFLVFVGGYRIALSRYLYNGTPTHVAERTMPGGFELAQNYPNPFNPETVVSYQLSVVSRVELRVFDLLGREVAVLANEVRQPGRYQVRLDGSRLASGVYFYRLRAGEVTATKKMMLLR